MRRDRLDYTLDICRKTTRRLRSAGPRIHMLVALLALAACSSDQDSNTSDSPTTPGEAPQPGLTDLRSSDIPRQPQYSCRPTQEQRDRLEKTPASLAPGLTTASLTGKAALESQVHTGPKDEGKLASEKYISKGLVGGISGRALLEMTPLYVLGVDVPAGQGVTLSTSDASPGSNPVMHVQRADGTFLGGDDDSAGAPNARVQLNVGFAPL